MNYKRITKYDDTFGYKPMCEGCERSEFDRCKPNECREVVLQRLGELEDAIENGDLVFAEYRVGDTYRMIDGHIQDYYVVQKTVYKPIDLMWRTVSPLFDTEAEAKKYLEELKNDKR